MIDLEKVYTREEFAQLLKDHPYEIGSAPDLDSEYNDHITHIVYCDHWEEDLDEATTGLFYLTNYGKLNELEDEAFRRVWLTHSEPDAPENIIKIQEKIAEEYNIDPKECNDFYSGYWSGVLAMCRFLSDNRCEIEDLREMSGELLDI